MKKLYKSVIENRNEHPEDVQKALLVRTKNEAESPLWNDTDKLESFYDDQVDAEQDALRIAVKGGANSEW